MANNLKKMLNSMPDDFITAEELSNCSGLSIRTVRNYVHKINNIVPGTITITNKGYKLNSKTSNDIFDIYNDLNEDASSRLQYISNILIHQNNNDPINIYDLSEELSVSVSTLNNDLSKLKIKLFDFDLVLTIKNNQIIVTGSEKNKRRYISSLIYQESNINFVDIQSIQTKFSNIDVSHVENVIVNVFNEHNVYINDYSLLNLVLHVTISLDRIQHNDYSESNFERKANVLKSQEYTYAEEIAKTLSNDFSIVFNEVETYELTLLVMSRISYINYENIEDNDIQKLLNKDCVDTTKRIINNLKSNYGVDFSSNDFFIRFAIHLQDLLIRSKTKYLSKNPLTYDIKATCPFLYEIAVSVAAFLESSKQVIINDDEIAYIAVHLGAMLEEQRELKAAVTAHLYYPDYYDMSQNIVDVITKKTNNKLLITKILTQQKQLLIDSDYDFLITVIPIKDYAQKNVVRIHPFLTNKDLLNIQEMIESIRIKKSKEELKQNIIKIFKPELFEIVNTFKNKEECIKHMVSKYVNSNYSNSDFYDEIMERENLSSTGFDQFAIPHSLYMNAKQTAMNIVICNKAFPWDNSNVRLILMMCFNKNERHIFNVIFDPLVEAMNNPRDMKAMLSCKTYDEFVETLVSVMNLN